MVMEAGEERRDNNLHSETPLPQFSEQEIAGGNLRSTDSLRGYFGKQE